MKLKVGVIRVMLSFYQGFLDISRKKAKGQDKRGNSESKKLYSSYTRIFCEILRENIERMRAMLRKIVGDIQARVYCKGYGQEKSFHSISPLHTHRYTPSENADFTKFQASFRLFATMHDFYFYFLTSKFNFLVHVLFLLPLLPHLVIFHLMTSFSRNARLVMFIVF